MEIKSIKPKDPKAFLHSTAVTLGLDVAAIPNKIKLYLKALHDMGLLDEFTKEVLACMPITQDIEEIDDYLHLLFIQPKYDFRDFILSAFDWSETTKGYDYWQEISMRVVKTKL